jgi:ATP synthase protein I
MSDEKPSDLDKFGAKLQAARDQVEIGGTGPKAPPVDNLAAVGMRISIELVVGLCVGLGIGWLIDRSLGTKPWFMLAMMLLGLTAGVMNVVRLAKQMDRRNAGDWERKE